MKSGTVEDYLKWTNDMWYIVKNKPCISVGLKFDLIKCFLSEEALEEWETCEATVTNRVVAEESGSESEDDQEDSSKKSKGGTNKNPVETLVGQTDETFKECNQLFLDQRIPAGSARFVYAQPPEKTNEIRHQGCCKAPQGNVIQDPIIGRCQFKVSG